MRSGTITPRCTIQVEALLNIKTSNHVFAAWHDVLYRGEGAQVQVCSFSIEWTRAGSLFESKPIDIVGGPSHIMDLERATKPIRIEDADELPEFAPYHDSLEQDLEYILEDAGAALAEEAARAASREGAETSDALLSSGEVRTEDLPDSDFRDAEDERDAALDAGLAAAVADGIEGATLARRRQ